MARNDLENVSRMATVRLSEAAEAYERAVRTGDAKHIKNAGIRLDDAKRLARQANLRVGAV